MTQFSNKIKNQKILLIVSKEDSLTRRATELNRIPLRDRIVISERLKPLRVTLHCLRRKIISGVKQNTTPLLRDVVFGSERISVPLADNKRIIPQKQFFCQEGEEN